MSTLSVSAGRQSLALRIAEARSETDRLFAILNPEALYDRPIPERHRIIFYIGHLEVFDWNLLREHLGLLSFNPHFDHLFAFGIDPVDGGLPTDQPGDWPAVSEVENYRERVRFLLDSALDEAVDVDEHLLNLAVEHRFMHAETLEYMFHQLPIDRKIAPSSAPILNATQVEPETVNVPAGLATLGLNREPKVFGWDNEFEQHVVEVSAFSIDKYKVTNAQFAEFIAAGGYQDESLWSPLDWIWKSQAGILHPVFWISAGQAWNYRTMFEEIPLPLNWPVYVSHAEASAYANWARKSLPTEAEWHRAAYAAPDASERSYPWGQEMPKKTRQRWDPPPVGAAPESQSAFGVDDLLSTGWEWTSSEFAPFPGFEIDPAYPGYSANFFDGKHYVMKGGSPRTDASMLRRTFRNWFQPHYQYVYAGFRCVAR